MSAQGISPSSTLNRTPKVIVDTKVRENGKVKNMKVTKQASQLGMSNHVDTVYTQTIKGVPSNLFRNSGAKFSAVLEQKSFYKLLSMCLRVDLSISGGAATTAYDLAVPTYWFTRQEYRASNGSRHLNIVYDDNLHFALSTLDSKDLSGYAKLMGCSTDASDILTRPSFTTDGSGNASVTIFIPVIGGWIDNGDLYWKNLDGDLVFDFHPASDIRATGDTYAVDCTNMSFVIQNESVTDADAQAQHKFYSSVASEVIYMDPTPVNFYNETINASQKKNFKLDSLNGEVAFLVAYIKTQGAVSAHDQTTLATVKDIGNDGTIDLVKSSGQSILGDGTAINHGYLKNFVLPKQFPSKFLDNTNAIIVPFGGSVIGSFNGHRDGGLYFNNSNYELSIVPDANFTSANYDVLIYAYRYRSLYNHMGRLSVSD